MSDDRAVLDANEAFYVVFNAGDVAAMEAMWATEHGVACIHPGWTPLESRAEVIESWESILSSPQAPRIRCADPTATVAGDMAFVVCSEILPHAELVATNIFVRERGEWKICHHHAAPIARDIVVEPSPPGEVN